LPGHVDDGIVADLEFDDLVAAMRAGSTPSQAIERMRETFNRRSANVETDKFPRLEDAVEYGDPHARDRALDFARENPPSGVSPQAAAVAIVEVLDSIGDTCPECRPD
jgi:hypothetical protein